MAKKTKVTCSFIYLMVTIMLGKLYKKEKSGWKKL